METAVLNTVFEHCPAGPSILLGSRILCESRFDGGSRGIPPVNFYFNSAQMVRYSASRFIAIRTQTKTLYGQVISFLLCSFLNRIVCFHEYIVFTGIIFTDNALNYPIARANGMPAL